MNELREGANFKKFIEQVSCENMLLGIYDTLTFTKLKYSLRQYSDFADDYGYCSILEVIRKEATRVDVIVFVLDDVQFPINPQLSITCGELKLICEDDDLFEKTIFVKGNHVIEFDRNLL